MGSGLGGDSSTQHTTSTPLQTLQRVPIPPEQPMRVLPLTPPGSAPAPELWTHLLKPRVTQQEAQLPQLQLGALSFFPKVASYFCC